MAAGRWLTVETFMKDGTRMALQQRVYSDGPDRQRGTEPGDGHRLVTVESLLS